MGCRARRASGFRPWRGLPPEDASRVDIEFAAHQLHSLRAAEDRFDDPHDQIVVGPGNPGEQPFSAFRFPSLERLAKYREALAVRGLDLFPSPSAVFGETAFAIPDPDGRLVVFGVPRENLPSPAEFSSGPATKLPGRLQHVVVGTANLDAMIGFYQDMLGFIPSDHVVREGEDGDEVTVVFYRSTPEHHSFAVFLSDDARPDHHAYETTCWNDIRDWADHFSSLPIKLWWGPGRHGPGNNLFIMIEDPHGYKVELSAELEIIADGPALRRWPHGERSLNVWGSAWMRS